MNGSVFGRVPGAHRRRHRRAGSHLAARAQGIAYVFDIVRPDDRAASDEFTTIMKPYDVDGNSGAAAHRRAVTEYMRGMDPEWIWTGPGIPATKPAYSDLVPTMSGEVRVVRPGPGSQVPGCDPETAATRGDDPPCWTEARIVDVFGADGRYLGELDVPDEVALRPPPFIRDDVVIARVEDEAGTIMVKRYGLVLPGPGKLGPEPP